MSVEFFSRGCSSGLPFFCGGVMVIMKSLTKNPSVPGPEYFDDGWKKVTNASK